MSRKQERLYRIWCAMRERCRRAANNRYNRYGGRGIKVCDEWQDYIVFKAWAIKSGYSDGLTIDRIDNNGNYEPSNCRWADNYEQANNKRNNHLITYNGETHSAAEWARLTGIPYRTILSRLNRDRMPPEKVFIKKKLFRDEKTGRYISKEENKENENKVG